MKNPCTLNKFGYPRLSMKMWNENILKIFKGWNRPIHMFGWRVSHKTWYKGNTNYCWNWPKTWLTRGIRNKVGKMTFCASAWLLEKSLLDVQGVVRLLMFGSIVTTPLGRRFGGHRKARGLRELHEGKIKPYWTKRVWRSYIKRTRAYCKSSNGNCRKGSIVVWWRIFY